MFPMNKIDMQLINKAQSGQREALSVLAELVKDKVHIFIYRITLDFHLAEDLTQETILEMIKSKEKLTFKHVNFFWAWIYRTALGKVQHRYRVQGNKRVRSRTIIDNDRLKQVAVQDESGIDKMIKKEQIQAVCDSINTLNLAHRSILTLRCFEQLTYPEIAAITGQTELQARVQFFRAKQSLKKRLARKGIGKDNFINALGMFGVITAGKTKISTGAIISKAAVSVTKKVAFLAILTSKTVILSSIIIFLFLITGGNYVIKKLDNGNKQPDITLQRAYNTFANPVRVIDIFDPDNNGLHVFTQNYSRISVSSEELDAILTRREPVSPLIVELPENQKVHLEFSASLVDGSGADILMDARNSDLGPRMFITDGNDQELELHSTSTLPSSGGFIFTGYDLKDLDIPFEPHAIRIQGCGIRNSGDCLELYVIKARINTDI